MSFHRHFDEVFLPPHVVNQVGDITLLGQTQDWTLTKTTVYKTHVERGLTGKGIKVGIVDTGTNVEHQDLQHAIVKHINGTSEQYSWTHGHGTGVSGVIAARNNAVGALGVAYESQLVVGKGMREVGGGSITEIVKTADLVAQENVRIINFSLGTVSNVPAFHEMVKRLVNAGIIVVCSAGNAGRDNSVVYPGKYEEAICVGAVNSDLKVSAFSSRGWEVDIAAPGERVFTPWRGGNDAYARVSGTSFSSPFVAGVIALLLEAGLEVNHENLAKTAMDIAAPGQDPSAGHGLIDPYKFLQTYGEPTTPAPIAPTPAPIEPTPAPVEPTPAPVAPPSGPDMSILEEAYRDLGNKINALAGIREDIKTFIEENE